MKKSNVNWITLKSNKEEAKPMAPRWKTKVGEIPGGWLLKCMHLMGASSPMTAQSMIFISDPDHVWCPKDHEDKWERIDKRLTPNFNEWTDYLKIHKGCIYRDTFFNKSKSMHISLVYIPE